jgi:transcriptional regulator GlxA family with amidase domain
MCTKTPQELRFDVLTLAHNDMMAEFHQRIEAMRMAYDDNNRIELSEIILAEIGASFPKTEDITQRAEELYAFVVAKD